MITGRKANIEEGIAEKWGRGFGQFTDLSGEGGGGVGGAVLEGVSYLNAHYEICLW